MCTDIQRLKNFVEQLNQVDMRFNTLKCEITLEYHAGGMTSGY